MMERERERKQNRFMCVYIYIHTWYIDACIYISANVRVDEVMNHIGLEYSELGILGGAAGLQFVVAIRGRGPRSNLRSNRNCDLFPVSRSCSM